MKEQMDRDTLLYGICPMHMIYDCCNNADTNYHCDDCKQLMNEWLDQYDKQIRADAIDDFAAYIREKVLFEEKWLMDCKSNNANTNIAFSSIMTFINSVAEELKKVEIQ